MPRLRDRVLVWLRERLGAWRTRDQAESALFAYIDGWYNTERIQARLGWLSPDEYETAWHADTPTRSRPGRRKVTNTPAYRGNLKA